NLPIEGEVTLTFVVRADRRDRVAADLERLGGEAGARLRKLTLAGELAVHKQSDSGPVADHTLDIPLGFVFQLHRHLAGRKGTRCPDRGGLEVEEVEVVRQLAVEDIQRPTDGPAAAAGDHPFAALLRNNKLGGDSVGVRVDER